MVKVHGSDLCNTIITCITSNRNRYLQFEFLKDCCGCGILNKQMGITFKQGPEKATQGAKKILFWGKDRGYEQGRNPSFF